MNFYLDKKGRPFYNLIYKKEKIIENSGLGLVINNEIDIYRSITREEIRDVANKYLKADERALLEYLPKKEN